jgi:hypothetical protein
MIPAPLQNILDRLSVAWHERAIALKAISFAFVGVVNTVIDFSIFWTAATYLLWPLVPANVLAWLVAVSFSYAMNSFTTFGPESGRILRWRDYATFIASVCIVVCLAGAVGQADLDSGELCGQLFTLALRRVPQARVNDYSPASSLA